MTNQKKPTFSEILSETWSPMVYIYALGCVLYVALTLLFHVPLPPARSIAQFVSMLIYGGMLGVKGYTVLNNPLPVMTLIALNSLLYTATYSVIDKGMGLS